MAIKNTTDTTLPVSIDYTNRDFNSLRSALIARVQQSIPEWQGTDPADFGVALVETFAYMGDLINYYIDRIANESFIYTANQRQSLLNLSRIYGYSPTGYKAASVDITITNNSNNTYTISDGSVISGEINNNGVFSTIYFTLDSQVMLAPNTPTTVTATHGRPSILDYPAQNSTDIAGKIIGYSDGTSNQIFPINSDNVLEDSVVVYVLNGTTYEQWSKIDHIVDANQNSTVYQIYFDEFDQLYIQFGNGLSGSIPQVNAAIKVQYSIGGGVIGNIPNNTLNTLYYGFDSTYTPYSSSDLAIINSNLTINNTITATVTGLGTGGSDPETNSSIRVNAANALSPFYRAITLSDYEKLVMNSSFVGKAKASADVWNSVNLYIAPISTGSAYDPYPLYDSGNIGLLTDKWTTLTSSVYPVIQPYTQIGVAVTLLPPTYVPVKITVEYTRDLRFTNDQVSNNIKTILRAGFSYQGTDFNAIVTPEVIEAALRAAPGVTNAYVTILDTNSGTSRKILNGAVNEIFTLQDSAITVTERSSVTTLSLLTTSSGSITLSSNIVNYGLAVASGVSTITLTPTSTDINATIVITPPSGSPLTVASGVTSSAISLSSGFNSISIKVTASDKIHSQTYTLVVTRG
jgi:hypothetical protein